MRGEVDTIQCDHEGGCPEWTVNWSSVASNWRDLMPAGWVYDPEHDADTAFCPEHATDAPIGVDDDRGIELFRSPQRPADAQGPERHISMAGAELHGHPDSCCCHTPCDLPDCHVPDAVNTSPRASA